MSQIPQHFPLGGGLDLVSPPVSANPGRVLAGFNHEPTLAGYQRADGFERYSGQPKPSEASYWVMPFEAGSVEVAAGDIVEGVSSLALAEALYTGVLLSGAYADGDAAGYLILTGVDGTFEATEALSVAGGTVAVGAGLPQRNGASSDIDDADWSIAAIDLARSRIGPVPGSGPVRGVWWYENTAYAFRDSDDGLTGKMYAGMDDGWEEMDLGRVLTFTSGGTYEIQEGDIVTGASSGATVTVSRVILESGDWTTGDAAGRLIIAFDETGMFQAESINVGTHLDVATVADVSEPQVLPAGGLYECRNHNFYGATNLLRMYGVNGVGHAFEWDGAVFAFIHTGMVEDTPNHIAEHKNHLFLSFYGGSVQHSSLGEPLVFNPVTGAAELGMGDDVTGFVEDFSGVLGIMCRNKIGVLYGNDTSDWDLQSLADESGGIEGTIQKLTAPIYMDDEGLRDMRTANTFGDFNMGSITQLVAPLFAAKKAAEILPVTSLRCRKKNQYRLYWADGSGIYLYLGKKTPEIFPFDLQRVPTCACSSEDVNGNEVMLLGDEDGYVYQLDAGTSWDGDAVDASLRLAFFHAGSPDYNKRWHAVTIDCEAQGTATIGISAEFDFGDSEQPSMTESLLEVLAGGGLWDEINWDQFYWSNPVKGKAAADIDGEGGNISIAIVSRNTNEKPYTVTGVRFRYSVRGLKRAA